MNRRAFFLGAIAAPIAAPVIAKAAAAPKMIVGLDFARGGSVTAVSQMMIGERGAEMVIPRATFDAISSASGIPKRFLTGEMVYRTPPCVPFAEKVEGDDIKVDITFPSLRYPET